MLGSKCVAYYLSTGTRSAWGGTQQTDGTWKNSSPAGLAKISGVEDLTTDYDSTMADTSNRDNIPFETEVAALLKAPVTFKMLSKSGDTSQGALLNAFVTQTPIACAILDGTTTASSAVRGLWADFNVKSFKKGEPLKGVVTYDVNLSISDSNSAGAHLPRPRSLCKCRDPMPLTPSSKHVFAFCVPSRGMVSILWAERFREIAIPMNCSGFLVTAFDDGGGEVAEGRNYCVATAPRRGATHLFWLDDDVCPSRFVLVNLFKLMRETGRSIVSGVYFTKHELSEPLIFPASGAGVGSFLARGNCDAWAHGMGLCLINADFYRKMQAQLQLPRDKYGRIEFYKTLGPEDARNIPDASGPLLSLGQTEDFYFLDLAAKLGSVSLIDMSAYGFGWHVDPKTMRGYPREQFDAMQDGKPIVWQTPAGLVVWSE